MSKITFRADDELIRQLEEFDASKSEVMREALRKYLSESSQSAVNTTESGGSDASSQDATRESLDDLVIERIDALIADRMAQTYTPQKPQDVNVNITLDSDSAEASHETVEDRKTPTVERENTSDKSDHTCKQCGENLPQSSVYCPNCGEKSSHRVFCECGDEIRSDWSFCPGCGRRTPAADVLRDS